MSEGYWKAEYEKVLKDNVELSQRRKNQEKYSTFVFYKFEGGLAAGYVEKQEGTRAHVKHIYPTPKRDVVLDQGQLMAIQNVDLWFREVSNQNFAFKALFENLVEMAKQPAKADWNGRR